MNNLAFAFDGARVRVRVTFDAEGNPWWIAKDVCECLLIKNPRDAVRGLDDDEKGVGLTDTLGGAQEMATVNEAGLYRLIFSSRKPEAQQFKRWLAHEVLPALRRHGVYEVEDKGIQYNDTLEPEISAETDLHPDITDWITVVREVRLTEGKAAARRLMALSPLPKARIAPASVDHGLERQVSDFVASYCVETNDPRDFLYSSELVPAVLRHIQNTGDVHCGHRSVANILRHLLGNRYAKRSNTGYRGMVLFAPSTAQPDMARSA